MTVVVEGGHELKGEVQLDGFKHSSNLAIAVALLSTNDTTINNVPLILDTEYLGGAARIFGFESHMHGNSLSLIYDGVRCSYRNIILPSADLHSPSYLIAKISTLGGGLIQGFGGCRIGDRFPYGARWAAAYFGVSVSKTEKGGIKVTNNRIVHNPTIELRNASPDIFSLAQKTAILFASAYGGRLTGIKQYQEINDLLSLIEKAHIAKVIKSPENNSLSFYPRESKNAEFDLSPDPIEYITLLSALAAAGGKFKFNNLPSIPDISHELKSLEYLGVKLDGKVAVVDRSTNPTGSVDLEAPPAYSDVLPLIGSAGAVIPNALIKITDQIWPKRSGYARNLRSIGCNVEINGSIVIHGAKTATGSVLNPDNLRDAAGALIAALGLNARITITGLENLKRGYGNFVSKLEKLGATLWRKE